MTQYATTLEEVLALRSEVQRLQDAKRRALAIADERAKENVALRNPSNEFINAFLKAEGSFIEAYEAPRESGVPVDMDISQDDADAFNAEARNNFRKAWTAALNR